MTETELAEVDAATMRDVLGHFATGVVVVTGMDGGLPVGLTCQSFASLSLEPPLVSFCPARSSTTWPRLRAFERFCVNVLAEDHESYSARFARSGGDKFAGLQWQAAPSGSPLLDGVCAWIDCELWREYDGGDHTIVVGRVTALGAAPDCRPLLYHRGRYGMTSDALHAAAR